MWPEAEHRGVSGEGVAWEGGRKCTNFSVNRKLAGVSVREAFLNFIQKVIRQKPRESACRFSNPHLRLLFSVPEHGIATTDGCSHH